MSATPRNPDAGQSRGAPIGALARPVNFTQSQIESAVVAMMARASPGGTADAAQARTVAQLLGSYVNDPVTGIPPGTVLDGSTEFARLVLEKAPILQAQANDPAAQAALAKLAEQQAIAGTGALPAGALQFINGEWVRTGSGVASGGNERSGARYDGMPGTKGDWSTPQAMAEMRNLAIQQGVPWIANNPDLLRLGPSAIQTLADVKLREESYRQLTEGAQYKAKDVVALARFAKEKKIDANDLAKTITENNRAIATDPHGKIDPKILEQLRDAQTGYMARPNDPAAKKKIDETLKNLEERKPDKKPHFDKLREKLDVKREQEQRQQQVQQRQTQITQGQIAKKEDAFNAFADAEPTSPATPSAAPPTPAAPKAAEATPKPGDPPTGGTATRDAKLEKKDGAAPEQRTVAAAAPKALTPSVT
jgi:hypothetical protein